MAVPQINTVSSKGIEELKTSSKERVELDREDFMKLFVTQLQYQDPMNPMESAEMASQVAQFNMVDLLYKNNQAMASLVDATKAQGLTDAVSFIGQKVTYKGDSQLLDEGGQVTWEIEPEAPTASTQVMVTDESGQVIRTLEIGAMNGEKRDFSWDGTDDNGEQVSPGVYTLLVRGLDEAGQEVSVTTWSTGTVTGLTSDSNGEITLSLDNGETTKISDIEKVGR